MTGAFLVVHLANHLLGLAGVEAHLRFMQVARGIYRQPLVEALLLGAFLAQGISGVVLAWSGWRQRRGFLSWLQAGTGLYLALFLSIHVGAVLHGRLVLGLDTNLYFAAAGLHAGYAWFFAPYYGLAVASLFIHVGCGVHACLARRGRPRPEVVPVAVALGLGAAIVITLFLAGSIHPIEVPFRYLEPFLRSAR